MAKRKFHTEDGETFEIIDDPDKPRGKPKSELTRRRWLYIAIGQIVLVFLVVFLVVELSRSRPPAGTQLVMVVTATPLPPTPTPRPTQPTATPGPHPCDIIMDNDLGHIAMAASLESPVGGDLFLMDAAGQTLCRHGMAVSSAPRGSGDGERLLFTSQNAEVAILNVRENRIKYLTSQSWGYAYSPFWSPDESQIVFERRDDNLYTMNADGSNLRAITNMSNGGVGSPSWSPDGEWIAFAAPTGKTADYSQRDSFEIFVIRPDGSDLRQLTNNTMYENSPTWSPDSNQIAFTTTVNPESMVQDDLFVVDANCDDLPGGCEANRRNLTNSADYVQNPKWLPDGLRIAYTIGERSSDRGIYVLDLETGESERITEPALHVASFDWWDN